MKCHQSALTQRKQYHHLHHCNFNKAKDKTEKETYMCMTHTEL